MGFYAILFDDSPNSKIADTTKKVTLKLLDNSKLISSELVEELNRINSYNKEDAKKFADKIVKKADEGIKLITAMFNNQHPNLDSEFERNVSKFKLLKRNSTLLSPQHQSTAKGIRKKELMHFLMHHPIKKGSTFK